MSFNRLEDRGAARPMLPKTASYLPLLAIAGVIFLVAGLLLRGLAVRLEKRA
jgi:hypothetical protein